MARAKEAGKLPQSYVITPAHRDNLPERIAAALKPARDAGLLPMFPFGTDFTDVEQRLIPALQLLREASASPWALLDLGREGLVSAGPTADDVACLARLGLDRPKSVGDRVFRLLVGAALRRARMA